MYPSSLSSSSLVYFRLIFLITSVCTRARNQSIKLIVPRLLVLSRSNRSPVLSTHSSLNHSFFTHRTRNSTSALTLHEKETKSFLLTRVVSTLATSMLKLSGFPSPFTLNSHRGTRSKKLYLYTRQQSRKIPWSISSSDFILST
jgi:hypothetical protein